MNHEQYKIWGNPSFNVSSNEHNTALHTQTPPPYIQAKLSKAVRNILFSFPILAYIHPSQRQNPADAPAPNYTSS